jgi:aspartate racemase
MKKKKIGIIGGMGPEALSDMYLAICKYYQVNFDAKYDRDFPSIIMYSVPIPDVVESVEDEKETLEMLINAAQTLEEGNCDFIVIACNSVQFLLPEIKEQLKTPLIGIAETVAQNIKDSNYKKVGILATQTTINKKIYNEELNQIGIELITPDIKDQEIVTDVIMKQLSGKATKKETKKLKTVIENLKLRTAEAILIACTDLPLVIRQRDTGIKLINCTELYANEVALLSATDKEVKNV